MPASLDTFLALLILSSLMCTVNTIVFSKLFHCYSVWAGKSKGNIARLVVETIWAYLILLRLNSLNSYQCRYKSIKWSSSEIQQLVLKRSDIHNRHTRNRAPLRVDLPPWNSLPSNIGNRRPLHNWNRPYNILNRKNGLRVNKSFMSLILFQLMIMMMNFIQVSRSSSWPGRPSNRGH